MVEQGLKAKRDACRRLQVTDLSRELQGIKLECGAFIKLAAWTGSLFFEPEPRS